MPASSSNISQPRSWIHADILIQGLIASPLDMPHRGGGPPPPHRLKPLLNPKTSHKFTRPPNKRKNEKKTQQLKLEELRELQAPFRDMYTYIHTDYTYTHTYLQTNTYIHHTLWWGGGVGPADLDHIYVSFKMIPLL